MFFKNCERKKTSLFIFFYLIMEIKLKNRRINQRLFDTSKIPFN
jgi:hypothetical protein